MLDNISFNRALEVYKERFGNASTFVYFFVGNYNPDTLKKLCGMYLGSLPATESKQTWHDIGARPPKGIFEKTVKMGQEPRSTVMLRWNMSFKYNRNNRNEVNALNKLLNIRLREVLREEKSGVYGVNFVSTPYHYPEQRLEQMIYFSCNPDNVNLLVNAALDVVKEIGQKDCEEKNLVKIKETALRERETYLKENSFWLNAMSASDQNGEDIRELLTYNEWVNALKVSDFPAFAKKYLQQDNFAKFVLLPE
jgi:zinc protease